MSLSFKARYAQVVEFGSDADRPGHSLWPAIQPPLTELGNDYHMRKIVRQGVEMRRFGCTCYIS